MTKKTCDNQILMTMSHMREIEIKEELQINLSLPKSIGNIQEVLVVFNRENENPCIIKEMYKTKEEIDFIDYEVKVSFLPFNRYENYFFFFLLRVNGQEISIKINRKTGKPFLTTGESPYWRILVTQSAFTVPTWAKNAVFYQIFVDRFCKSQNKTKAKIEGRNYRSWGEMPDWRRNEKGEFHNNDFFGGDIKGIEEKIEYLKNLGVDVLYISPINFSTYRYERYAATNHLEIDPEAGDFEDLDSLHRKANSLGMHIILDIAFNHCNSDNPIFQDAINNPNSKYRNWFYIDNQGNYEYWYGLFKDMPIFNQYNHDYQQYVYGENGVIAKFAKYVDGFRLDLAEALEPFFLEGIRKAARRYGRKLILGEYWEKARCEILGKGLDCVTNYPYANAVLKYVAYGEAKYLEWETQNIIENYPENTLNTMLNALDTHDTMRALTLLSMKCIRGGYDRIWEIDKEMSRWHIQTPHGIDFLTDEFRKFEFENDKLSNYEYDISVKRLKIAFMLMGTLPGNLCIFYGTEKGVHGFKDPFNRKCMPWENGDKALEEFFRKYLHFWKKYKGSKVDLKYQYLDDQMCVIEVQNDEYSMLTILNRSNYDREIQIPEKYLKAKEENVFIENGTRKILHSLGGISIIL